MELSAAWLAVAVAAIAASFAGVSAYAAVRQTKIQREIMELARRPQPWADIRPHPDRRSMIALFVGNSGPTIAHDVKVEIEPPVRPGEHPFQCEEGQRDAAAGIAALAPGRVYEWVLGFGPHLLDVPGQPDKFTITLTARTADGTPLRDELVVRFDDVRNTSRVAGNLESIAESLKGLTKGTTGGRAGPPIQDSMDRMVNRMERMVNRDEDEL